MAELKEDNRKDKEKLIFKELEAIRVAFNERKLRLKYKEDDHGLPYAEWKKKFIEGDQEIFGYEGPPEEVNVLEKSIFVDDPQDTKVYDEAPQESADIVVGDTEMILPIAGEGEQEAGEISDDVVESAEVPDTQETQEKENIAPEVAETVPDDKVEVDESFFSWSDIDLGVQKPDEVVQLSDKKKDSFRKMRDRKATEILEFQDLRRKTIVEVVGYVDPLHEPHSMKGAQSLRFVDADYGRCNELSLNGLFMSDILASTLQEVIEELENEFNLRFKDALDRKGKDIARIRRKTTALLKNLDDLVNVCRGELPMETLPYYSWTRAELMPQYVWSEEDMMLQPSLNVRQLLKSVRSSTRSSTWSDIKKSFTSIDRQSKDLSLSPPLIKHQESFTSPVKPDSSSDDVRRLTKRAEVRHSIERMMGGVFQQTWQEKLRQEIQAPSILLQKDPDDFTEEDAKLVKKYYWEKAERERLLMNHRNKAEEDVQKLLNEIEEIVYNHDTDLLDLFKRKANSDSCIQSELLKIARMKLKRLIADRTLKNIRLMQKFLVDFNSEGKKLSVVSKIFLKKVAVLQNELEKHQALLKNTESEFFNEVEPLKLTKKSLELLRHCFKKKPTLETENTIHPTELVVLARCLLDKKCLPYQSKGSSAFLKALDEIDSPRHCPPHVSQSVWNTLTNLRRVKIVSDLKAKALQMYLNEAEKTASTYYKYFVTHVERFDQVKCHIRDQKIRLQHHCRKIEFQILLPEGLIEAHHTGNVDDFKDCVYISRNYIDNLNDEIVELQKLKEEKWKDFDNYMLVVNNAEWLHKELRLKLRIKKNLFTDLKTAKINKYTKEFLSEYYRRSKPNYSVNLRDHKKQEQIKTMVAKYFNSYYRTIKSIKDIKNSRENWHKETMALAAKNNKLAAENQDLFETFEELNAANDHDEQFKQRNKALTLHGKLVRTYEANAKKIEELENELHRLYMKNYPTFSVR